MGADTLTLVSPAVFSGTVVNSGHGLIIEGGVSAVVEMTCSRCAEKLHYPVQVSFHEVYLHQRETASDEEEIHYYDGDKIDILPQAIRAIL
ncbi:MAG: DUF177 domain-containing protein [Clostridia bacterium]|nr:DUF177 domain-containing protein [Clostridia bacterium]